MGSVLSHNIGTWENPVWEKINGATNITFTTGDFTFPQKKEIEGYTVSDLLSLIEKKIDGRERGEAE